MQIWQFFFIPRHHATLSVTVFTNPTKFNKIDLQALYFSGTYCHNTILRPPSCGPLWQLTMYLCFHFSQKINSKSTGQKKITSIYHGVCCSGSVLFSTGGESLQDFVPLRRLPGQHCFLTLTQAQLEHSVRIPSRTKEQSTPNINGGRSRSDIHNFSSKSMQYNINTV